jgi:hypothetical protein
VTWLRRRRPYREVMLSSLIEWRDSLIADIHWNMQQGGVPISDPRRRELARIVYELKCRSEAGQ